ncbi:MAG: hypothetical protein Q8O51_01755 [bacterium]|nr:hypothetical protein [bacterium]
MNPVNATELIAFAKSGVDAEVFEAAFMHYMPGSDGSFEELLTVIALYQPKVFLNLGLDPERVRTITDLLHALQNMLIP